MAANLLDITFRHRSYTKRFMSLIAKTLPGCVVSTLLFNAAFGAFLPSALCQTPYESQGQEFSVGGALIGDQINPHTSIGKGYGFVVWEDNRSDAHGLGISARRLDANYNPTFSPFRVNEMGEGDQSKAKVIVLEGGNALFVWQSSVHGVSRVVGRFVDSTGRFVTGDIPISPDNGHDPVLAPSNDGGVFVTWTNRGSDGSMDGIYALKLSSTGAKVGDVQRVNSTTRSSQRSAGSALLSDGRLAVAWISENQVQENSLDAYVRIFNSDLTPSTGEVRITAGTNLVANPSVVGLNGGGFVASWSQLDVGKTSDGWDVWAREFDNSGVAIGSAQAVNNKRDGWQKGPQLASIGNDVLITWGQSKRKGASEDVYGRFWGGGRPLGESEFVVNTTKVNNQQQATVASDASGRFLVVWTGFTGLANGFDIYGQRFGLSKSPLVAPAAPIVTALSSSRVSVSWPAVVGFGKVVYELYANGSPTPVTLDVNYYTSPALAPGARYSVSLSYRLADGSRSPVSSESAGTTWGEDGNGDGLPDDWQSQYFGGDSNGWTAAATDPDGDGASNLRELLAGTNPKDASSVLRARVERVKQGKQLSWNTQPGLVYQVQIGRELGVWTALGEPRFAGGRTDSLVLPEDGSQGYFRVIRLK